MKREVPSKQWKVVTLKAQTRVAKLMKQYSYHPSFRSKCIQVSPANQTNTACSPVKHSIVNVGCSPIKQVFHVELLVEQTRGVLTEESILLILKKIGLHDAFAVLGDDFGISTSRASRIFSNGVLVLAAYLKHSVESIIDCLEIEIERPGNEARQALTWSQYKQCNTVKYLVSCTPDGYGGRVSDVLLLEDSGYLDMLTPGCTVMADHGFKHIEEKLVTKQCELVRPPSVSAREKCGEEIVKRSKRISSLRIRIERLLPHMLVLLTSSL
ncbi:hypothetical protein PR048_019427, partial [Dryococelus australis]